MTIVVSELMKDDLCGQAVLYILRSFRDLCGAHVEHLRPALLACIERRDAESTMAYTVIEELPFTMSNALTHELRDAMIRRNEIHGVTLLCVYQCCTIDVAILSDPLLSRDDLQRLLVDAQRRGTLPTSTVVCLNRAKYLSGDSLLLMMRYMPLDLYTPSGTVPVTGLGRTLTCTSMSYDCDLNWMVAALHSQNIDRIHALVRGRLPPLTTYDAAIQGMRIVCVCVCVCLTHRWPCYFDRVPSCDPATCCTLAVPLEHVDPRRDGLSRCPSCYSSDVPCACNFRHSVPSRIVACHV